jgi:TP901 family phage tail tape measure protein
MAKVELNIVALGDFSSVNAQISALRAQIELLNKGVANVGLSSNLTKDLQSANAAFKSTMLSTGQFTQQTISLKNETAAFGDALTKGKLKLSDYYNIIKQNSGTATASVKALALEQAKLNNSIITADPTKSGVFSVYTPTKINEIKDATNIATQTQNLYNIAVDQGTQKLINWGKNTQWAGRQLTVGMTIPLMIFGQQATASFKATNTELTRLQRLYGEGLTPPDQGQINQISDQVLKLGRDIASTMGIAQSETVKAAANFAAMGEQGQDLINTTQQTMRLSKLGAVSTADATNTIVALQNVYKVSTNELGNAVNFLSDIQKQTTMTLGDMTQAIPRVGPIMQQLGGTYKDTAVMLVAMREAGVPAAQAANALKSAMASMIAPTSAASKEFQKYGINLAAIKDNTQGNPVQMIEALQSSMSKLSPLVKEQLIDKLFGKFQFARISALLNNFGQVGSQTQNALKVAGATSGQLADLANQEMKQATESGTAKFQRAVETFKADIYPIGQKIMEVATSLMNFGNSVAKIFTGLPGPVKTVLGIIAGFVVLSGPILMLTGLLANFTGYLVKGYFNLKNLATGGKTLGQLLTPELIASQNAAQLFSEKMLADADAVVTLNAAVEVLTVNMSKLVESMNAGAGISDLTSAVGSVATAEARIYEQMKIPGFATGGYIPGSGNSDTFPAMLTPGEAVIPKKQAAKYAPFISAMINGRLPGFSYGLDPNTGMAVGVQRGHVLAPHDQATVDLLNSPEMISAQNGRLTSVTAATRGAMMTMPTELNQSTRSGSSGVSSSEAAAAFKKVSATGINPMADLEKVAKKLGADMSIAKPKLKEAYDHIIAKLEAAGNSSEKIFGTGENQRSLESWMEEQLRPTLQQIKTKVGENLDNVTQNIIGTRGNQTLKNGQVKTGSTGQVYYREADGSVVPLSKSSVGSTIGKSDVHTTGRRAIGSFSGSANEYNAGKEVGATVLKGAREEVQAASPARKFEQLGLDIDMGLAKGVKENKAVVDAAGSNVISGLENDISSKASGKGGIVGKIFGLFNGSGNLAKEGEEIGAKSGILEKLMGFGGKAMSKMTGMGGNAMSKMTGMLGGGKGLMAGVGMSMGAGIINTAIQPLLKKLPGGSILSESANFAATGAMFGPWGAAAGAALGLAAGGIGKLIGLMHQHAAVSKATFSPSASAAQYFGTAVENASTPMDTLTDKVKALGPQLSIIDAQAQSFAKSISQLPKDNAMSVIFDKLKNSNGADAGKLAKSFADTQMAVNGMNQKQAQQMIDLYLESTGHKDMVGKVKAATNASDSTASYLKAGGRGSSQQTKEAKSYGDLGKTAKSAADKLLTVANQALNTKSFDEYKQKLDGIKGGMYDTTEGAHMYALALENTSTKQGDAADKMSQSVATLAKMGLTLGQIIALEKDPNGSAMTDKLIKDQKAGNLKAVAADMGLINASISKGLATQATTSTTSSAGGSNNTASSTATEIFKGTAEEIKVKDILTKKDKDQKSILKTLQDQFKLQQKITAEQKAQMQYQMQQQDLNNQMKDALITGNYLGAAGLKQQVNMSTVDFMGSEKEAGMQDNIDKVQAQSDTFAQALADLNDAIASNLKVFDKNISNAANMSVVKPPSVSGSAGVAPVINNHITVTAAAGADHKAIGHAVATAAHTATASALAKSNKTNKVTVGGGSSHP